MKRVLVLLAILLVFSSHAAIAERIEIGGGEDILIDVNQQSIDKTTLLFDINAFNREPVTINGKTYYAVSLPGEGISHDKSAPALPYICRSLVIPDDAHMKIEILSSDYIEYTDILIAPSKGHIKRTVDPSTVPYKLGPAYETDDWSPAQLAKLNEPYILRDLRGIVAEIHPFQYNPAARILRVYTKLEVEISANGPGLANVLNRRESFAAVDPAFEQLYKHHFINYDQGVLLYTPVPETGDMLIITYDSFYDTMLPLVEWKNQKGIKTTLVRVSPIGNNATSIASYIQDFYDSTDLAWVLLVGDAAQVATPTASGGSADPTYAKVAGTDYYPDIFIGRFSAETAAQANTQVERTINYEKYPQGGVDWYHKAIGIASNLGPGHYGEYDYQHMNNIRNDLLGYNYTDVDQIYDPEANQTLVANALNAGRGFVNYVGHGDVTEWGSSGFANSDVNALTNDNKLPFIFSVACLNGVFNGYTCFGEAWLRATDNGNPTGAIGTYMSAISQDWDPPMYAQDEATDLLVAESKLTFGGICFNASCYMIDAEGSVGADHFNTWHIFGDPSVMFTTDIPTSLTVAHDATILFTADNYTVDVPGVAGALCALYYDGVLYGSAYTGTSGQAVIPIGQELPLGESITLTVTAYNHLPYIGSIQAISPSGAYVVYDSYGIDDIQGNNNGVVDFGETIDLDMQLKNVGPEDAIGVVAVLSSSDSYVTITDSEASFGTITGNSGAINITDAFRFETADDIQDGHIIPFHLEITGSSRDTWNGDFYIETHAPVVGFAGVAINDNIGNGNGILEPGETAELVVTLSNDGSGTAYSLIGALSTSDSYLNIADPAGTFGDLGPGNSGSNIGDVFVVTAASDYPQGHAVTFNLDIAGDGNYAATIQFTLRTAESFEFSDGGYTGDGVWQWGTPISGPNQAYYGANVWATNLAGNYPATRDDDLISTAVTIYNRDAILEFYQWYDIEDYYDGGNVQISVNGGDTWAVLTPVGGYPEPNVQSLGQPGYSDNSGGWVAAQFELGDYIGNEALLKWRFASDNYTQEAGWYIDDVSILNNIPLPPPAMTCDPRSFVVDGEQGQIINRELTLTNDGDGPLYYDLYINADNRHATYQKDFMSSINPRSRPEPIGYHPASMNKSGIQAEPYYPPMVANSGGPDTYGYRWIDSNQPGGPIFNWKDITATGTRINGIDDDTNTGPFPIGFAFDYYGISYTSFRFCTNGFISFTSTNNEYENSALPNTESPVNLIAPFWDDLNFEEGGEAYYYSNNSDSLIISWIDVPHFSTDDPLGPYTFQIILTANGKIVYQYLDINGPSNSATVGIQNVNGTDGLEVVYNANYVVENLAIKFATQSTWLTAQRLSGTVATHEDEQITITFDAGNLEPGTLTGSMVLESNDPVEPNITIPVTFIVGEPGAPDISVDPAALTDSLIEGEQAAYSIAIINSGDADLIAAFTSSQSWIALDDEQSIITPGTTDSLVATLNTEELTTGDYEGAITIGSNDPDQVEIVIPVSLTVMSAYACEYTPGDVNSDGLVIGSDVTFAVNFFRGIGGPPPDSCYNENAQDWLYVAADANGDCRFIGSDVTFLVTYFRGIAGHTRYCPDLPPSNLPAITALPNTKQSSVKVK